MGTFILQELYPTTVQQLSKDESTASVGVIAFPDAIPTPSGQDGSSTDATI